jgi:hypothetical protein
MQQNFGKIRSEGKNIRVVLGVCGSVWEYNVISNPTLTDSDYVEIIEVESVHWRLCENSGEPTRSRKRENSSTNLRDYKFFGKVPLLLIMLQL